MSGAAGASVPVDELAGRGLDACVAEEVMGWSDVVLSCWEDEDGYADCTWHGKPNRGRWPDTYQDVPEYSTDIAAAWEVVGALPWDVRVEKWEDGTYVAVLIGGGEYWRAPTAPEAICRAALKAFRGD